MENNLIENQLVVLQEKLQQMLKQYRALQKENEQLKKELEKKNTAINKTISEAKNISANLNEKSKADLEKRIDLYLKEIDTCLLLLAATS